MPPPIVGYTSEEECVASTYPAYGGMAMGPNGNTLGRDAALAGIGIAAGAIDRALGRRLMQA